MYNLGDDRELDRLSREAAGKYNPPVQPDWEAMHQKLDEIMPVEEKKRRIVFFWWLFPLLLVGGTAIYWLMQNGQDRAKITTALSGNTEKKPSLPVAENAGKAGTEPAKQPVEQIHYRCVLQKRNCM